MLCLGLDPGRSGGGLLTDGGEVVAAMRWRGYTRDKRKQFALVCCTVKGEPSQQRGLAGPWAIGVALRSWLAPILMLHGGGPILLACEAAHIGRNARTGLALSRFGGALAGPLEEHAEGFQANWAEPSEWRATSFRNKWWKQQAESVGMVASARVASRLALERFDTVKHAGVGRQEMDRLMKADAKALFMPMRVAAKLEAELVMPQLMPGLAEVCAKVDGSEHVMDAAGLNRWLWRKSQ